MPPGGHIEPDETPQDAARRECKEETGMDVQIFGDDYPNLFAHNAAEGQMLVKPIAMLLENIPESKERGEPAHQHMDFLFIAKPVDETQALTLAQEEAREMKWFSKEDVEKLDEQTEIFSNVKAYILRLLLA